MRSEGGRFPRVTAAVSGETAMKTSLFGTADGASDSVAYSMGADTVISDGCYIIVVML